MLNDDVTRNPKYLYSLIKDYVFCSEDRHPVDETENHVSKRIFCMMRHHRKPSQLLDVYKKFQEKPQPPRKEVKFEMPLNLSYRGNKREFSISRLRGNFSNSTLIWFTVEKDRSQLQSEEEYEHHKQQHKVHFQLKLSTSIVKLN